MFSPDVDALVSGFDSVIQACVTEIQNLSAASRYQIISDETHGGVSADPCEPKEREIPYSVNLGPIQAAAASMATGMGNAKAVGDSLYCGANAYNSSSGSPWTEIDRFNQVLSYVAGSVSGLSYVGDKAAAMGDMNMLLSLAVDAKHAVIAFHDSLTRGIDAQFNGNKPSITWKNSVKKTDTTGNIENQPGNNNVHVPEPNIDPY